jgi:hypothetical protein
MIASLRTFSRVTSACLALAIPVLIPIIADAQSTDAASPGHGPPPILTARRTIYVLVDAASDRQNASLVALATADELNKAFKIADAGSSPSTIAWAVPEASWKSSDFAQQCRDDPNAIGAVLLSYFAGDATHFWLLWQTQTTTFELAAQILSCNQPAPEPAPPAPSTPSPPSPPAAVSPEVVAVISTLHGANGTPWVERRTDASVPLLSGIALVALFDHGAKSQPTNVVTVATIGTALVGQSVNKDVPGYSPPVRYRLDAHHVGIDVVAELRFLCGQPEAESASGGPHLASLCTTFNWASAKGS